MDYIEIIHKDTDSKYGVSFPDFPGCVTVGATLEEAKDMAVEALAFHIEGLIEDKETIPAPASFNDVMVDPVFQSGVAFMVQSSLEKTGSASWKEL